MDRAVTTAAMSQFHFDPATYLDLMRAEVPAYGRLQEELAEATVGIDADDVLDLGTGTGETLAHVLERQAVVRAIGIDISEGMLATARERLAGRPVELAVADLADPDALPEGPFDLVVSALAVHHLDARQKADLFERIARTLRPGGRFVLADVVVPEDPADAVTPLTPEHDRPSSVAEQLGWLHDAGLLPHVVWTERDLAVIRADRPA